MIAIFPEIAAAAAAGDPERLAVLVRRYFGGRETYAPRLDVAALLVTAGLTVDRLPIDGMGALLAKDERGRFTIVAVTSTTTGPKDEQTTRFLLAHMLGHFLLDVQPLIARGDFQVSGYREASCPGRRYGGRMTTTAAGTGGALERAREEASDRFAAALLMPVGMLRRAAAKLCDTERVAQFFGVTRACAERRMIEIGALNEGPVNFLHAEASLGEGRDGPDARADDDALASQVTAPAEVQISRSVAASSYGQSARTQRKDSPIRKAAPAAAPASPADDDSRMDRIRAIARKLDKSAPR